MSTGFFVDIGVITTISNIANLGLNAAGTIVGIDIAKEQLELKEEIAEIKIDIEKKINDRQIELLDLQIESFEAQNEIENQLKISVVEALEEQAVTVEKEEELKRLLLSMERKEDIAGVEISRNEFVIDTALNGEPVKGEPVKGEPVKEEIEAAINLKVNEIIANNNLPETAIENVKEVVIRTNFVEAKSEKSSSGLALIGAIGVGVLILGSRKK